MAAPGIRLQSRQMEYEVVKLNVQVVHVQLVLMIPPSGRAPSTRTVGQKFSGGRSTLVFAGHVIKEAGDYCGPRV